MTGREFSTMVEQRTRELKTAREQNEAAIQRAEGEQEALARRRDSAFAELTEALLPDLGDATVQRVAALTGYSPLAARPQAMAAEAAALQQKQAKLAAEPAYRDRQLLRAPRVGTLARAIDELVEFRAPLAEVVARCAHPRLDRLIASGYGTSSYNTPFWRLSYYSDWEAADQILERFPGKSFADVREEFLSACSTVKVYDERLAQLRAEVQAGEKLEREHDELTEALRTLPQRALEAARRDLGTYLRESPADALGERFAASPEHLGLLKRALGLVRQGSYLEDATSNLKRNEQVALQAEIDKAERQIEKYQRSKNAWAPVPEPLVKQTQERLQTRLDKAERRRLEYLETRQALTSFDRYDSARLASDFLWWDLMTGGRIHGGYIPEVARYRERYPHGAPVYDGNLGDDDWMNAAAAAARAKRAPQRAALRQDEAQGLTQDIS